MGWSFGWATATELRDHIREQLSDYDILGDALVSWGRRYYAVIRPKCKDPLAHELADKFNALEDPTILQVLFEKRDGQWGYKDVSEECGPVEVDCPLSLMALVKDAPAPNEFAREWRQNVLDFHNRKRLPVKRGDKVYTSQVDNDPYTVTRLIKRTIVGSRARHNGKEYRIPRTRIYRVEAAT